METRRSAIVLILQRWILTPENTEGTETATSGFAWHEAVTGAVSRALCPFPFSP